MNETPKLPEMPEPGERSEGASSGDFGPAPLPGAGPGGDGKAPSGRPPTRPSPVILRGRARWVYVLAGIYILLVLVPSLVDTLNQRAFLETQRTLAETEQESAPLPPEEPGELAARRPALGPLSAPRSLSFAVFAAAAHFKARVWEGDYWRLLTSTFLHANLLHLGFNVLFLIVLGRVIERWLGSPRFLAAYFLSALGGAFFFQAVPGINPGVGASGGIYGLLGMILALYCGLRSPQGRVLGRRFLVFCLVAIVLTVADAQIAGAMLSGAGQEGVEVALSAHFGGFLCGVFLGYLAYPPANGHSTARRRGAAAVFATLLLVVGVYGIFYPLADWSWHIWRAEKAVAEGRHGTLDELYRRAEKLGGDVASWHVLRLKGRSDLEEALGYWESEPIEDLELSILGGYDFLYDPLLAEGRVRESDAVLDDLIRLSDEALERDRTAGNLNDAAWFRALRETELDLALEYAREACRLRPSTSGFVNTLGWVYFQRGEYEEAFRHLRVAAEREATGQHYYYLALARWQTGGPGRVGRSMRELVLSAFAAGGLMEHQRRILGEIQQALDASG